MALVNYSDDADLLAMLSNGDGRERAQAAILLKRSFSQAVGDNLIDQLFVEQNRHVFWRNCCAVIPKWIVALEHRLASEPGWPFDGARTAILIAQLEGWTLPSIERHLAQLLSSDDPPS